MVLVVGGLGGGGASSSASSFVFRTKRERALKVEVSGQEGVLEFRGGRGAAAAVASQSIDLKLRRISSSSDPGLFRHTQGEALSSHRPSHGHLGHHNGKYPE